MCFSYANYFTDSYADLYSQFRYDGFDKPKMSPVLCSDERLPFETSAFQNSLRAVNLPLLYINTNEIPGELSRENMVSSHVKRPPFILWLHNKSCLSKRKVKGLVFHSCLYNHE